MLISGEEIVLYFIQIYEEQWIAYFNDKKSMKSLWESINAIGIRQSSLSTLYSHHKMSCFSRDGYISRFVQVQNIEKIMSTLNIEDENIEKALPDALRIYAEQERINYNNAVASYRKKR